MGIPAEDVDPETLDIWADPAKERFATPATIITFIRTIAAVTIMGIAINLHTASTAFWTPSLKWLCVGLVVYWAATRLTVRSPDDVTMRPGSVRFSTS